MGTQVEKPDAGPDGDQIRPDDKALAKRELAKAKKEFEDLGGWRAFKDGRFLFPLVQKAFNGYYAKANAEDFRARNPGLDDDQIAAKLITEAARYAAGYGVVTGAVISTDEIVTLVTGGEGGVGLPANVAIAVVAVCAEAICLVRIHLQLIANLAKLTGTPLNADDPEDILIILAYAFGGSAVEVAGKLGMKLGQATSTPIIGTITKSNVLGMKTLATKIGSKLLRRSIIKYTLPLVSMMIGGGWNYTATKSVGKIALKHLTTRANETAEIASPLER